MNTRGRAAGLADPALLCQDQAASVTVKQRHFVAFFALAPNEQNRDWLTQRTLACEGVCSAHRVEDAKLVPVHRPSLFPRRDRSPALDPVIVVQPAGTSRQAAGP